MHGSTLGSPTRVWDINRMDDLADFADLWAFEKKYPEV